LKYGDTTQFPKGKERFENKGEIVGSEVLTAVVMNKKECGCSRKQC
jgi:hypothetical protein